MCASNLCYFFLSGKDECEMNSGQIFPNVDEAARYDGSAHSDDGSLLDQVQARPQHQAPTTVLVHPGTNL